jgi:hypothetical protein
MVVKAGFTYRTVLQLVVVGLRRFMAGSQERAGAA